MLMGHRAKMSYGVIIRDPNVECVVSKLSENLNNEDHWFYLHFPPLWMWCCSKGTMNV